MGSNGEWTKEGFAGQLSSLPRLIFFVTHDFDMQRAGDLPPGRYIHDRFQSRQFGQFGNCQHSSYT